jgi:hypothetical protein
MKKVIFKDLKPSEVPCFNLEKALHILDFRATAERLTFETDSMFQYENWISAIPVRGFSLVNSDVLQKQDNQIIVQKDIKSSVSIAARYLKGLDLSIELQSIFAHIPHPDIDQLSQNLNIPVSYTYADYLKYNNKFSQKGILGNLTPAWKEIPIGSKSDEKYPVIKRADGSGGWGVFITEKQKEGSLSHAYDQFPTSKWFAEEFIDGKCMSVQIYKENNMYTVFGFGEQIIENQRNFVGARAKSIDSIVNQYPWIKDRITEAILHLDVLIDTYVGFMGIDFILPTEKQTISILEANVRMTSVSITMLLANERGSEATLFEGYKGQVKEKDIILSKMGNELDVIIFS